MRLAMWVRRVARVPVADVINPTLSGLQPVSGSTRVIAGTSVSVRADAIDNVAVTAVDFTAEGAATASGSANVVPPATPATTTFSVAVPAGAANGATITVRGRARDAAGNLSTELALTLTVGDTSPPTAAITQPAAGTVVHAGPVDWRAGVGDRRRRDRADRVQGSRRDHLRRDAGPSRHR